MSSAHSITAAVNPPRAVYLDYPLGHTAGKAGDRADQMNIMRDTLAAFERIEQAGTIVDLPYKWRDSDAWKDGVMRPGTDTGGDTGDGHNDDQVARVATPQYQTIEDEHAADSACPTCVFLEQPA